MNSKVSVIMMCNNAEKYIAKAIESILCQTYDNWELIVMDDNSTDRSLNIIKKYAEMDARIKTFVNQTHRSAGAVRNLAINYCSGDYIIFLDAADIAEKRCLEKQVGLLDNDKSYGGVGGQVTRLDANDHTLGNIYCPSKWRDIKKIMFFRNPLIDSSMMLRKSVLKKYHITYNEYLKKGYMYLFWIEMCIHCRIFILKDTLVFRRENLPEGDYGEDIYSEEDLGKEYQGIYRKLWMLYGIETASINEYALVNALIGKSPDNIAEAFQYAKALIKYGMLVSGYKHDRIVFDEMRNCIKKIYYNLIHQYYSYFGQFQFMRECVSRYGEYPYPKYMVLPEKRVIYLEMPKVANCAIKVSMLQKEFEDDYSIQKEALKNTVHSLNDEYNNYYKFTFVRNPLERLVSCYESKYHKDRKMLGKVLKELEYTHYLFGYIRQDRGFTNFLVRIALIPDKYKDHHFKPQYRIVYDNNDKKRVDFVGKYENLNREYQQISSKFHLDRLKVYNQTERNNYMEYYNKFTARLAYFIYRKDIQYFGYQKEYRELIDYLNKVHKSNTIKYVQDGLTYKYKNEELAAGGSCDARYCYSVWMRHLIYFYEIKHAIPDTIAEFGPGDTIGTGIIALLTGVKQYYALDFTCYAGMKKIDKIFHQLLEMLSRKSDIPDDTEFPNCTPKLKSYSFPNHILTDEILEQCLSKERVKKIKTCIQKVKCKKDTEMIHYLAPWWEIDISGIKCDMVFSQTVLEHVDHYKDAHKRIGEMAKPGAVISHDIDFDCHTCADKWNGHWSYGKIIWKLIYGTRPWFLNRAPLSSHIKEMQKSGIKIVKIIRTRGKNGISRQQLCRKYRNMKERDFVTKNAYVLGVKKEK